MNKTSTYIFLLCFFALVSGEPLIALGDNDTDKKIADRDQIDMDIIMNLNFFDNMELLEDDMDFTEDNEVIDSLVQNKGEENE